jgi:hypothetical protein
VQLSTPAAPPRVSSIAAILAAAASSPKPAPAATAATKAAAALRSSSESSDSSGQSDHSNDAKPAAKHPYPPPPPFAPAKETGEAGTWLPTPRPRQAAAPAAEHAYVQEKSWKELWQLDSALADACAPLDGAPVVGTVLAYRVVELTAAMMPQMTDLRQGVVTAYDPTGGVCTLRLWPAAVQGALERAQQEASRRADAQQAQVGDKQQEQLWGGEEEEEWCEEEEAEVELPCEPYQSDGTLVMALQELMDVRVLQAAPSPCTPVTSSHDPAPAPAAHVSPAPVSVPGVTLRACW